MTRTITLSSQGEDDQRMKAEKDYENLMSDPKNLQQFIQLKYGYRELHVVFYNASNETLTIKEQKTLHG